MVYGASCKFIFIDHPLYLTCFKKAKKAKTTKKKLQSDDFVWFVGFIINNKFAGCKIQILSKSSPF